jgi:hypothetical protein
MSGNRKKIASRSQIHHAYYVLGRGLFRMDANFASAVPYSTKSGGAG